MVTGTGKNFEIKQFQNQALYIKVSFLYMVS